MRHRRFDDGPALVLPVAARQHACDHRLPRFGHGRPGLAVAAFEQLALERLNLRVCGLVVSGAEQVRRRQVTGSLPSNIARNMMCMTPIASPCRASSVAIGDVASRTLPSPSAASLTISFVAVTQSAPGPAARRPAAVPWRAVGSVFHPPSTPMTGWPIWYRGGFVLGVGPVECDRCRLAAGLRLDACRSSSRSCCPVRRGNNCRCGQRPAAVPAAARRASRRRA